MAPKRRNRAAQGLPTDGSTPMSDDKERVDGRTVGSSDAEPEAPPAAQPETPPPADPRVAAAPTPAPPAEAETELAALRDRHLRLAAEFDNFRKRVVKERTETWEKAQGDLVLRLAEALDDLTRFVQAAPDGGGGVDLVERKFWKELSALGVSRIDETGVPFDPTVHEAVTTAPAPDAGADHTVGAVLQAGYRIGKTLLRPARVTVLMWQGGN